MVPGKQYTIEDYLQIAWRRRWLIVLPFVLASVTTAAIAWKLPNQYRSEAVLEIVGQRVPSDYVQPTVTSRPDERLRALQGQILSRTRLEQIIRDFDLYQEERRTWIMEDVIDKMRTSDIQISIPRESEAAFRISYVGRNARTVQQVTERLTSLFIEENLRDRERLAEGTDQFLEAQLQDARTRLIAQEKRLEGYRQQHAGELPSQVQSNLQALQNVQLQVQGLVQGMAQDHDRKMILEQQLADARNTPAFPTTIPAPASGANGTSSPPVSATQQLAQAQATLRAMELRLTPAHPDLVRLKKTINELQLKADQEVLQMPVSDAGTEPVPVNATDAARLTRVRDLTVQIDSLGRQITQKQQEERRLRGVMAEYQRRLAAVPTRESELMELTRDHETLLNLYTSLLAKKENARMAVNMERRQIGEQFRVLDPARVPERPFSPNRPQIYSMGLVGGLLLGLTLAAFLEYRDTSLRVEADVVAALALPVFAMVPAMSTSAERRHKARRRRVLSISTAMTLTVFSAVLVWLLLR